MCVCAGKTRQDIKCAQISQQLSVWLCVCVVCCVGVLCGWVCPHIPRQLRATVVWALLMTSLTSAPAVVLLNLDHNVWRRVLLDRLLDSLPLSLSLSLSLSHTHTHTHTHEYLYVHTHSLTSSLSQVCKSSRERSICNGHVNPTGSLARCHSNPPGLE